MHRKIKYKPITDYKTMDDTIHDLGLPHNNVYCGYLRQPIVTLYLGPKTYRILGHCSLNDHDCQATVTPTDFVNYLCCDTYKQKFKIR